MKVSKKYISICLAAMLSLGTLTGCGSSSTKTENATETESAIEENIGVQTVFDTYTEKPEAREYRCK